MLYSGIAISSTNTSISDTALLQINAFIEEKQRRTPAQKKLASNLLYASYRHQGLHPELLLSLRDSITLDDDGMVLVDINARVSAELIEHIKAHGGQSVIAHRRFNAIRAALPMDALEDIASHDQIDFMRPADRYIMNALNVSEGDISHAVDVTRVEKSVDGTGVKSCVISDSIDALASIQSSDDLPTKISVLTGQSGLPGTSEGTAMLEIIHDLAPGASLGFASGKGGQAQMAQNILDLSLSGCDVIVDNFQYINEPVFQDGPIAQTVDQVTATGAMYYTAAGNSGNLSGGTSSVYESDYQTTILPLPLIGAGISAHNFGLGVGANTITVDTEMGFTLQWADPMGQSDNDYDLFLLNVGLTNILSASTTSQTGTQDPYEFIDSSNNDDTASVIVIVLTGGSPLPLHLNAHGGQFLVATDGQIYGHAGAAGANAVGAVDVNANGGAPYFKDLSLGIQSYSSDGPRRIYFHPDGSPISGQQAAGGQSFIVRNKPDLVAADQVSTATPGFSPFIGTSAAAAHAAGIATLLKHFSNNLGGATDPRRLSKLLRQAALDIQGAGVDRNSGFGIVMGGGISDGIFFATGMEDNDILDWTN
ncbi:MAG: hypothetical protein Tsb002_32600 [Wenzhouxiangellaceae bacterium]